VGAGVGILSIPRARVHTWHLLMWVLMRRNVTISLDDAFIPVMDKARRGKPRGRWIEGLAKRYAFGFDLEPSPTKSPTVEAGRGPALEEDQTAVPAGG
jgi:hypothetical protein